MRLKAGAVQVSESLLFIKGDGLVSLGRGLDDVASFIQVLKPRSRVGTL